MGMINAPQKCFITDSPTVDYPSSYDSIEYTTEYAGQKFFFSFSGKIGHIDHPRSFS
jgi:hypothetical protein